MTTATRNEAAGVADRVELDFIAQVEEVERLMEQAQWPIKAVLEGIVADRRATLNEVRSALAGVRAAERRATVERIRERLPEMMKAALPGAFLQVDDLSLGAEAAGRILDEEAAL